MVFLLAFPVWRCILLALIHLLIFPVLTDTLIGRTNNFTVVGQLLHTVGTPAGDTCHSKNWGIQLHRKLKHMVNKTGIEVHIDADTLVNLTFFGDNLGSQTLNQGIKSKFLFQSLFHG